MIVKVDRIIAAVRSMETMHTAQAERRARSRPNCSRKRTGKAPPLTISISAASLLQLTDFQDESTRHRVPKICSTAKLKRNTAEVEFNRRAAPDDIRSILTHIRIDLDRYLAKVSP